VDSGGRTDSGLLGAGRVAHLATADAAGRPHVVPVCFVFRDASIYIVIDAKPKRTSARALRRVRNILENDRVALVVDDYEEDWARLRYVLVFGRASLLEPDAAEHGRALQALRAKYPQYRAMALEDRPVVKIRVERTVAWRAGAGG
jgi:PPOX class probable F420-dependent enzyme